MKRHIYNAEEEEVFAKKMKYLDKHKLNSALFIELENSITLCLRKFQLTIISLLVEAKLDFLRDCGSFWGLNALKNGLLYLEVRQR